MRTKSLFAAAVVVLAGAMASQAAITINSTRATQLNASGQPTGNEIVRWFALVDGGNGTKLLGVDLTMATDEAPFIFRFQGADPADAGADLDGDGVPDADVANTKVLLPSVYNANNGTGANRLGSAIRPMGGTGTGQATPTAPTNFNKTASQPLGANSEFFTYEPQVIYGNLKQFRVAGAYTAANGRLADAAQNGGLGQMFAIAVVPANTTVRLKQGSNLGGDLGGPVVLPADVVNAIPEPGTIGLLGLGLVGLLACRSRKA